MNFEMSWTGKREHRNLSFELAHASHPAFCSLVLPLLRSALHELVLEAQAHPGPEISEDHIVWTGDSGSPLLHLCQTFAGDDIREDELRRCRAAIQRFAESGRRTNIYLVVHNRDGRDTTYREAIQSDLGALAASGQAARAEVWDRQRLLREAFNGMLRYTFAAVQRKNLSTAPIETLTQRAPYTPLEEVPCSISTLLFDQYRLKSVTPTSHQEITDPAAAILNRSSGNLFLLTGSFGQGKTTTVARALVHESAHLLYVAGARISRKDVRSTKDYLQRCINERELLASFPDEDFPTLRRLVRPVIQRVVSEPDLPLVTVIDGIDESSFLSRHGGLQQLFNTLQEIKTPVVLTMRTELWDQGRDMFESAFGLPPQRVSPRNREVIRVELLPWDHDRIRLLIERYRDGLEDTEGRTRLDALSDLLARGELGRLFGDIPQRPLFLRLLLDTVAETDLPAAGMGRARLLHDWALLKLHRDISAPLAAGGEGRLSILPGSGSDPIRLAWEAMLQAAASMIELVEGMYELTADCPLERILRSAEGLGRIEDPLGLFLNTLLLPSEASVLGRPLRVRFAHRAFQEFFLAWFWLLHPEKLQESPLPDPVREWVTQIQAEGLIPAEASRQPLNSVDETQRADLEIRVSLEQGGGSARLRFILNSPSGRVDVSFLDVTGPPIARSPEEFRAALISKLERLGHGFDVDESLLVDEEVRDKLIGIGRDLYKEIFPPEVRSVYRRVHKSVQTLMITTDEPWIPWELIRPYDAGDPADLVDDDFLCLQFEMTRWMIGRPPARAVPVRKLACLRTADLPSSPSEQEIFSNLVARHSGVENASPPSPTSIAVKALLQEGGLQLLHVVGHGTFDAAQPNEAGLPLPDGISLRPVDLHGPLQTRIEQDRPLVFLNACRAAQQSWHLTGLGGWAQRWVRDCGCGAFIGPVWAVSDRLAFRFAEAFYAALERGETFGQAARTARRAVQQIAPGNPAWLAYSVYAHPKGKLILGFADSPKPHALSDNSLR